MSFYRLIFYHAMLGGWAAFVGWLFSEVIFLHRTDAVSWFGLFFTAALVVAYICAGIALLGGIAKGSLQGVGFRFAFCLLGGLIGGALGGLVGNLIFQISSTFVLRALGWMLMGLGIGCVEGIFDRSPKKIRNGMIGGAIGGLIGGLCFFPLASGLGNMSGRAIALVILGMCIGLFIGLAQIIMREAWLTVEQGFRPGRQFVLNIPITILGTSEKSQLPFIAFGAKGVEPIHVRIEQRDVGGFEVRDNNTRTGTFVNGQRVEISVLKDNDVIQLGPNVVRFRESVRHGTADRPVNSPTAAPMSAATPLPAATAITAKSPSAVAAAPSRPMPAASSAVTAAPGKPRSAPAVAGTAPAKPAATAATSKNCPKCGNAGLLIPSNSKYLCVGCGIQY